MSICKGACNFSLNRNNILKCICEIRYIESFEVVWQLYENINQGFYECHY